jgi:hypothetical protein
MALMGEVVEFRNARAERELERHFGLPRGAAFVSGADGDRWADRHRPIAGDLYTFAKSGAPQLSFDISIEAASRNIITPERLQDLATSIREGRDCMPLWPE